MEEIRENPIREREIQTLEHTSLELMSKLCAGKWRRVSTSGPWSWRIWRRCLLTRNENHGCSKVLNFPIFFVFFSFFSIFFSLYMSNFCPICRLLLCFCCITLLLPLQFSIFLLVFHYPLPLIHPLHLYMWGGVNI